MTRFEKPPLTDEDLARALQIIIERIDKDDYQTAVALLGSNGRAQLTTLQAFALRIAQRGTGGRCFVCGGHVQIQYRIINKAMARVLCEMCTYFANHGLKPGVDYIKPEHVLRSASGCREHPRFRFWGYLHGKSENPEAHGIRGKRPVLWTLIGRAPGYALGKVKIHRWAIVLHDELIRLAGPLMSVREVEGFDLDEYMAEIGN